MEKIAKIKSIVSKILTISLVAMVFAFAITYIVYQASKRTFYFFNHRFDVVLTGSMATKNEKYLDFLEGHDDQIDAFDFAVSEKVTDDTPLNVYDRIVFDNPRIGTTVHRIVDIAVEGTGFLINHFEKSDFHGLETFKSNDLSTKIESKQAIIYNKFEALIYTETPLDIDEYHFNVNYLSVIPEVASTQLEEGYYSNIVSYSFDNSAPLAFSITKKSYQFRAYFSYLTLSGGPKDYTFTPSIISGEESQEYLFYPVNKYMIRGDAAPNEDGWFYQDSIYAKVSFVIPKFGYISRFISSPYGVIMIVGLGMIPFVYTYFIEKGKKNEE